jgi:DNA-binding transcriptional LysR family regulator
MSSPTEPIRPRIVVNSSTTRLLPQLAAFLAVADAGSFSAAARRCHSDKSVMSRQVKALESALGLRLLNRTTRSLTLTPAGRRLFDDARDPIQDAATALGRARDVDHLEGSVRVASAQSLAASVLVPALAALRLAHPHLRVELYTSERMTPLVEQGFELGIRVGRMPDSNLISRRLASWRHVLVASPGWVDAHPDVAGPADLAPHWLLWGHTASAQAWTFERGDEHLEVRMETSPLVFDTSQVLAESARAGLGVAALPPFAIARELAEGTLVRLFPRWRIHDSELGVFGVTPHRTLLPARVQAVLEAVRGRLRTLAPTWRQQSA